MNDPLWLVWFIVVVVIIVLVVLAAITQGVKDHRAGKRLDHPRNE